MYKKWNLIILGSFFLSADDVFIKQKDTLQKKRKPSEIKESIAHTLGSINKLCADIVEKSAHVLQATMAQTYDFFEQESGSFFVRADTKALTVYENMVGEVGKRLEHTLVSLQESCAKMQKLPQSVIASSEKSELK